MSFWKSCLRNTTVLTAVLITAGSAQAGSGSILYQMDYVSQFGSTGTNNGEFQEVEQIVLGSDNKLYVADTMNNRIQVFDKDGNYIDQFGSIGTGNGQFTRVFGIAFTTDNKIAVADDANRVQLFDPTNYAYISQFGSPGAGNGQFNRPTAIAVNSSGDIYVVDRLNARVEKFDSQGNYLSQISGVFSLTLGVAVSANDNVYVADDVNNTVSIYDSSNNFLGYLATGGSGAGQVSGPTYIAFDIRGNVYVNDYGNNRLSVFDKNGVFLFSYNNSTSPSGSFNVTTGIAIDNSTGKVYVGESFGNRVNILQLTSTETFADTTNMIADETAATPLSNLVLDGVGGSFAHDFIGYNNVNLVNGSWTLSGNNNFAGNMAIAAGTTLTNNGTVTFNDTSMYGFPLLQGSPSSVIAGTGIFNSVVIGNISPGDNGGNDIGTLTVNGLFVVSSYLRVNVNAAGQSDKLVTTGIMLIDSAGILDIQAIAGSYAYNTSYVIIEAAGGVLGTFDPANITSNFAFLLPALDYSNPNQVTLTMTNSNMASIDFAPFAGSSNQQSAGIALTAFSASQFGGNTAVFNTVMGLSQSDASLFLSQIAPDEIAALPQVQRSMISNMQQPLFQRLSAVADDDQSYALYSPFSASAIRPDQVWVQTLGGFSNQDSTSNGAAGYRLGMVGTRVGADKVLDNGSVMGISAAYAHGTADYTNSNDKSETQYGHADLYGRHSLKDTSIILEGFIGAGGGRMDSTRFISAGGLGLMAEGNTNAYDVSASLRASNPIKITQQDTIIPNITTNASWTRQNSFTETGAAPFNLNVSKVTATPVTITPMINWQHTYTNKQQGFNLTPDLGIGATWQLNELDNQVNANFSNATGTPGFTVSGAKQSPLSINLSASVTMEPFSTNQYVPQLQAQATTQISDKTSNATATLSAKWNW